MSRGDTPSMHTLGHSKRSHAMPRCGGVEGKLAKEAIYGKGERNAFYSFLFKVNTRFGGCWSCSSYFELKGPFKKGGLTHTHTRLPYRVSSTAKKHEEGAHLITPSLVLNFHDASIAALLQPSFLLSLISARKLPLEKSPVTWHSLWEICPFDLYLPSSM